MPYLSTSQEFLKESALLIAAYPKTTRITTKYSYPKKPKSKSKSKPESTSTSNDDSNKTQSATTPADTPTTTPTAAPQQYASLTLKTYHPDSGICLKYTTNKAAEVGRLIASLGKLASGAPVEDAVASAVSSGKAGGEIADVEMGDNSSAPATGTATPVTGVAAAATAGGGAGVSKKGKKKGGKKR